MFRNINAEGLVVGPVLVQACVVPVAPSGLIPTPVSHDKSWNKERANWQDRSPSTADGQFKPRRAAAPSIVSE